MWYTIYIYIYIWYTCRKVLVSGSSRWYERIDLWAPDMTASAALLAMCVENTNNWLCCCVNDIPPLFLLSPTRVNQTHFQHRRYIIIYGEGCGINTLPHLWEVVYLLCRINKDYCVIQLTSLYERYTMGVVGACLHQVFWTYFSKILKIIIKVTAMYIIGMSTLPAHF